MERMVASVWLPSPLVIDGEGAVSDDGEYRFTHADTQGLTMSQRLSFGPLIGSDLLDLSGRVVRGFFWVMRCGGGGVIKEQSYAWRGGFGSFDDVLMHERCGHYSMGV
jgi:hypothetical protein